MQAGDILKKADALFAAGKGAEAAAELEAAYQQARQEEDWHSQLTLVNELMGYCRTVSRFEQAWEYVAQARSLLDEHGISQTLAGVTTQLNIATVYRADGRPLEALEIYRQVEQVYLAEGLSGDCRLGGLYNNMAVSCLEAGEKQQALVYARSAAAAIAAAEDAAEERAIIFANLASVLMQADPPLVSEAELYLEQALALFRNEAPWDPHYGGALAARAYLAFRRGQEDQAIDLYRQAMSIIRRAFGENRDYQRLAANLQLLLDRKEHRG